ncbi:MAG: hypothetical protein DRP42_04135, partial [Tenericutes bacterium]
MSGFTIPTGPVESFTLEQEEGVSQQDINRASGIESQRTTTKLIKGRELDPTPTLEDEDLVSKNTYGEWAEETSVYSRGDTEASIGVEEPEIIAQNLIDSNANLTGEKGSYGVAEENAKTFVGRENPEEVGKQTMRSLYQTELSKQTELAFFDSVGGTLSNIGGIFIPKRGSVDLDEIMVGQGFISHDWADVPGRLENMGMDTDSVFELRGFVQRLPTEEARISYFNDFVSRLDMATDNNIIKADLLTKVFGTEEPNMTFSKFENYLDLVGVGEVAGGVRRLLSAGGEALNVAKYFNDGPMGARILEEARKSPEVANKLRVTAASAMDSVTNVTPESVRNYLNGAPDDIADEIVQTVEKERELIAETVDVMDRVGLQTPAEQAVYRDVVLNKYRKQEGVVSGSVEIKQIDDDVFEVSYKKQKTYQTGKKAGQKYNKTETITEAYRVSGVKGIKDADELFLKYWRSNPNARSFGALRDMFVSIPERLLGEQSKLAGGMAKSMKAAYKGIWSPRAKSRIDDVLRAGEDEADGAGIVYDYDQLVNVGVGPNHTKLSPKEARAYYGHRAVLDELHNLTNTQFTESLDIQGVKVIQNDGINVTAFVYDSPDEAWEAYQKISKEMAGNKDPNKRGSPYITSFDADALEDFEDIGGIIPVDDIGKMTKDMFQFAYERGMVFAKNHTDKHLFEVEGGKTQWAFTAADTVRSPRGMRLLNYKVGYNPRVRQNAFYFVKSMKGSGLSGAENTKSLSTSAWANSRKEAQEWIDNAENPDLYEIVMDREMSDTDRMYDSINTGGGMYLGARKSKPLEFAGDIGEGNFVNTMEALGHYINHAAKTYPTNLYRAGLEARSVAIARKVLGKGGTPNQRITSLDTMLAEGERVGVSAHNKALIKMMHDQVKFLNNMPTASEARAQQRFHNWAEALQDNVLLNRLPGFKNIPFMMHKMGQTNFSVSDTIRGVTFKHMLGMWNPDQIIVQASGFVSALSINPIMTMKSLPQAIGFGALDLIRNTGNKTIRETVQWYRDHGLEDFADGYEFWTRSGMYESVMHTHADYQTMAVMKNLPIDNTGMRKVIESQTIPYQMGELFNTRMSFMSAYHEYRKTNGIAGQIPIDDREAMRWIKTRAESLRLNMTRANQSELNKGVIAVPLQFKQVIFKYFEKIIPDSMGGTKELKGWEKFRLAAMPAGIYGASTIPGGDYAVEKFFESQGRTMDDISPTEISLARRGILGTAINYYGNMNINVSDRLSLGTDFTKAVHDTMSRGFSFADLFGPSANVAKLYLNNGKMLWEASNLYRMPEEIEMPINKYQL